MEYNICCRACLATVSTLAACLPDATGIPFNVLIPRRDLGTFISAKAHLVIITSDCHRASVDVGPRCQLVLQKLQRQTSAFWRLSVGEHIYRLPFISGLVKTSTKTPTDCMLVDIRASLNSGLGGRCETGCGMGRANPG